MTDANSKIGFRQLPPALKFAVVWTIILGLLRLWEPVASITERSSINLADILAAIVYFNLASGLTHKQNSSRIWSIIFLVIGTLARFVFLVSAFNDQFGFTFNFLAFEYDFSQMQTIIFLLSNIVLNTALLYILLRPSAKALFTPPPAPVPAPQEPA